MDLGNCHKCGVQIEPGFDVCWKCGSDVEGGPPPEYEEALHGELGAERDVEDERAFRKTWAGQARAAREAGQTMFQMDAPLSRTRGTAIPMLSAFANSSASASYSHVIQEVEAEGWRLEHVGYIYRLTGSDSREKFMSGEQQAFSGEIVGVYLFRLFPDTSVDPELESLSD